MPSPKHPPVAPVAGLRYLVTPTTNSQGQTLVVPNPERGHQALPNEGTAVVWSVYWQKRLKDGEVSVKLLPSSSSTSAELTT